MEMPKELVIQKLEKQVKSLQYDCAELQKHNDELAESKKTCVQDSCLAKRLSTKKVCT